MSQKQYPIFITTHNRLQCLTELVEWLEGVGQEEIYFVDNESSYEPLLEYFKSTPHTVLHVGENIGNESPWRCGYVQDLAADRFYVVTDPDIVPVETCPNDAFEYFEWALETYPQAQKVSFSLELDDIPDYYKHKDVALELHSRHQIASVQKDDFWPSPVDAIMALHRPNSRQTKQAYRAMPPYKARHLSWYDDSDHPTDELTYYRRHSASHLGNWSWEELPGWVMNTYSRLRRGRAASGAVRRK